MGQSSSKNRQKGRKDNNKTLRVPSWNGSFGRGYKFTTGNGTLTVPPDNGVRNKFHSAPRARPRSNENSSRGVIVYSSSDAGQPIGRIQHRAHTRTPVQQVFGGQGQLNHQPAQHGRESHKAPLRSPPGRETSNHTTYRTYTQMTVGELNGRKAASRKPTNNKAIADGQVVNQKKTVEVATGRRIQHQTVQRHVPYRHVPPDSGYTSATSPNRPPFVPPWGTKKDLIPNPRMFQAIDSHAMKCPAEACSSLRSLVTYLTQSAQNDLQRIRVIYRWITSNIRYDINAVLSGTYKRLPCDPLTVLHTRKTVCQGFANLFAALCREVDLMVKIMTGFSKDFFYDPENPFQYYEDCNHAWNIVYVHGEWRQVDCTWSTGYIDDNNHFHARFNDFHFLTDPDKFVWSHFPYVKEGLKYSLQFQLLSRPISLDDFNKKISPSQAAIEWGVELASHRDNVLKVDQFVKIEFCTHGTKLMNVSCRMKNIETSEDFSRYAVARRRRDGSFTVTAYPPYTGTFRLQIYGHPLEENHFYLSSLVSYTLQCTSSISRITPYPANEGMWGVKVDAERYGFARDIYREDFFVTDNGELEFNVGMVKNVTTMLKLHHAVLDIPNLNDYVTTEYSYSGMKIKVRFPKAGYYKLSLFGKPQGLDGNRVDLIADYLVQCKVGIPDCPPFPRSFPFTQSSMSVLLEPESGWLPAHKPVTFIIKSENLKRVLVDGKGAPPATRGVFKGHMDPKSVGDTVSIFGNVDGGVDHDELYRFTVVDTRTAVTV